MAIQQTVTGTLTHTCNGVEYEFDYTATIRDDETDTVQVEPTYGTEIEDSVLEAIEDAVEQQALDDAYKQLKEKGL